MVSFFPQNRNTTVLDADMYTVLSKELELSEDEGKIVVKRNGQIVRDQKTLTPLPPKQVIENYFAERKWIDAKQAVNLDDINTATKFEEKWLKDNPGGNIISPEYMDAILDHSKKVKGFDMYT